jgi:hypothetical protein
MGQSGLGWDCRLFAFALLCSYFILSRYNSKLGKRFPSGFTAEVKQEKWKRNEKSEKTHD